jgi:curved DNA-binding protein
MAFIDYYKTLGIEKTATEKEIKNAYRKQARKYHPDLNPNDTAANKKFQELNEANEVLSDPEKRKKYDKYGENWQHGEAYEQQALAVVMEAVKIFPIFFSRCLEALELVADARGTEART